MPHDARKYAVITHDFADSPKLQIVSVEARWALLEMILYSCRMRTDGRLSKRLANARWGLEVCQDLLENDPVNPSLFEDNEDYVIHDFLEHQTSKGAIKALSEKRQEAGRKGGIAKSKRISSKPLANAKAIAKQTASKTPSKSVANLKQKKKKKEGGATEFATATEGTQQAPTPPLDTSQVMAAGAADQPDPTRCAAHQHLTPDAVPNCWRCAQARQRYNEAQAENEKRAGKAVRDAIDACDLCDESGWVNGVTPVRKCSHTHGPF